MTGLLFDGPEIGALAAGVDADRTWSSDFQAWLECKRDNRQHRVTAAETLAGAVPTRAPAATVGDVLARLGLDLVRIELVEPERASAGIPQAA